MSQISNQKNNEPKGEVASSYPSTIEQSPASTETTGPTPVQKAMRRPASLRPSDLLYLQRTVGNQTVQRLLSGQWRSVKPPVVSSPATPARFETIQRVWKPTNKPAPDDFSNTDEYEHYMDEDSDPQRFLSVHYSKEYGFLYTRAKGGEKWEGGDPPEDLHLLMAEVLNDLPEEGNEQPLEPKPAPAQLGNIKPTKTESKKKPITSTTPSNDNWQFKSTKEKRKEKSPQVDLTTDFDNHVFQGEKTGQSHTGLHSWARIKSGGVQIKDEYLVSTPDANGVRVASVTMKDKTKAKDSVFFPETMSENEIKTAVREAFANQLKAKSGLYHWIGTASNGLIIAGLSTTQEAPKDLSEVKTAYPAYNGEIIAPRDFPSYYQQKRDKSFTITTSTSGSKQNDNGKIFKKPLSAQEAQELERSRTGLSSTGGSDGAVKKTSATSIIQRGKYTQEMKERGISTAEQPAYESLRDNKFEKQQISDAGHHGKGADFIAEDDQRLWVVEAKGNNSNWTSPDNLNFASGPHVPAKQINWGIDKVQKRIQEKLQLPLSQRVNTDKLLLVVTNLNDYGPMMAVITRQDKFGSRIVEKHPVTIGQVVRFVTEYGQADKETLLNKLYGEATDDSNLTKHFPQEKVEALGKLYGEDYNAADSAIEKIIEESLIMDWQELLKEEEPDTAVYDYLETAYNLARLNNHHDIIQGGHENKNPDSTKSLLKIKETHEKNQTEDGKYYIYLHPVRGSLPTPS